MYRGNLGGLIRATVSVEKSYFSSNSESSSQTNASLTFKKFLKTNGGQVTGSTTATKEFMENSELTVR